MHKKGYKHSKFTREQQAWLRLSPYVKNATDTKVSYTLEFKERFWEQFSSGAAPEQIFYDHGLDPDLLGKNRVWGLATTLRRQKENGESFREIGGPRSEKKDPPPKFDVPRPPKPRVPRGFVSDNDVRKLSHQVAYLSQELEFIKKIISAETGGRSKK